MNPKPGEVYFEITAIPHDSQVNGERWSTGTLPAEQVVTELRDLADFIDRYWREPQECVCDAMEIQS